MFTDFRYFHTVIGTAHGLCRIFLHFVHVQPNIRTTENIRKFTNSYIIPNTPVCPEMFRKLIIEFQRSSYECFCVASRHIIIIIIAYVD